MAVNLEALSQSNKLYIFHLPFDRSIQKAPKTIEKHRFRTPLQKEATEKIQNTCESAATKSNEQGCRHVSKNLLIASRKLIEMHFAHAHEPKNTKTLLATVIKTPFPKNVCSPN